MNVIEVGGNVDLGKMKKAEEGFCSQISTKGEIHGVGDDEGKNKEARRDVYF